MCVVCECVLCEWDMGLCVCVWCVCLVLMFRVCLLCLSEGVCVGGLCV